MHVPVFLILMNKQTRLRRDHFRACSVLRILATSTA
jgi:hypothetical protein